MASSGYFFSGLARGFAGALTTELQRRLDEEVKKKESVQKFLMSMMTNPDIDPAMLEDPDLQKMMEKNLGKDMSALVGQFHAHISPRVARENALRDKWTEDPSTIPANSEYKGPSGIILRAPRPARQDNFSAVPTNKGIAVINTRTGELQVNDQGIGPFVKPPTETTSTPKPTDQQYYLIELNYRRANPGMTGAVPHLKGIKDAELERLAKTAEKKPQKSSEELYAERMGLGGSASGDNIVTDETSGGGAAPSQPPAPAPAPAAVNVPSATQILPAGTAPPTGPGWTMVTISQGGASYVRYSNPQTGQVVKIAK